MIYGTVGILIALFIVVLVPTSKDAQISPYVTLDQIPGYGVQLIMVSQSKGELENVHLTISRVELLATGGDWDKIWSSEISWDILQEREKTFMIDSENVHAYYLKARIHFEPGPNKSNVTLSDGNVLPLEFQMNQLEVNITETVTTEATEFALDLRIFSGKSSIHILPDYRVQVVTARFTGEITGK
jgi:hypothetical protein